MRFRSSNTFEFKFKADKTVDERSNIYRRLAGRYHDKIPVICEPVKDQTIGQKSPTKYLIPYDLTVGQFMYIVRKKIKLEPQQAIFLFVNGTIPSVSTLFSTLYKYNRDEDGFLYVTYSEESTFG